MKDNRRPVSAQALYDNPDIQGYMFNQEHEEMGLDPWIVITGMDELTKEPKLVIEYGVCSEKIVDPDFIVYVSNKDCCITNEEKSDQYWESQ